MNNYETTKEYLTQEPRARERRNRARTIFRLLERKRGHKIYNINVDLWTKIYPDAESLGRAIRKVQEDNPHLRGMDYDDKEKLVKNKLEELYG